MAKWWEVLIPVGGALAGTGIGAYLQGLYGKRINEQQASTTKEVTELQLKHDREMRFLEEKRNLYARFLLTLDRHQDLTIDAEEAHQKAERYRNAEIDSLTPEERGEAIKVLQAAVDLSSSIAANIREILENRNALQMVAPYNIIQAAVELSGAVREGKGEEVIEKLHSKFVVLAKKDLGTHLP